jgi:hypothetical protein
MEESEQEKKRLQNVLKRAKKETMTKDIATFAFARFFTTLLALLAPFFKQTQHK